MRMKVIRVIIGEDPQTIATLDPLTVPHRRGVRALHQHPDPIHRGSGQEKRHLFSNREPSMAQVMLEQRPLLLVVEILRRSI